jgi:CheY-like chemotaxis protein
VVAEVDGDKLRRVFINLLSNAFKYAPNDSTVRLALTEDGDHISLTVENAGPGVPADLRETIFERFQQGDRETQRRYGGTSLGFSIVKEFIAMHAGSVVVGKSPAGGTQVRVRIPRHAPDGVEIHCSPWIGTDAVLQRLASAPPTAPTENAQPATLTPVAASPEVLVVEDNQDMRDFICRVLAPDAQTRTADNGRAALEAVHQRVTDLILTDMMMPVMTGEELVATFRKDESPRDVSDIPAIAMSGYGMEADIARVRAADFAEHIVKHVTSELLRKMLVRYFTQSASEIPSESA